MSHPPATPRQSHGHDGDRAAAGQGSILKTLFSPAAWFKGGSGVHERSDDQVERDPDSARTSDDAADDAGQDQDGQDSESSSDEEEQIGLVPGSAYRSNHIASRPSGYQGMTTPAQPTTGRPVNSGSKPAGNDGSPNAVLADFFARKGDQPLSAIELAGVQALLQGNSKTTLQTDPSTAARLATAGSANAAGNRSIAPPSYITPSRRPYRPIFTPARQPPTGTKTEVRKVSRPGYLSGATTASPFRQRNVVRAALPMSRIARPVGAANTANATPTKYTLTTQLSPSEVPTQLGKRILDEVAAPAAKRRRPEEEATTPRTKDIAPAVVSGQKTAASMLEILESNTVVPGPIPTQARQSPEQLKSMLNPYAPPSARKTFASPRRHQNQQAAQRTPRTALEEIERSAAMAAKQPYQPKQASALAQSFTANDDEVSLFSPKRAINGNQITGNAQQEHRAHGGFTFGAGREVAPTPSAAPRSTASAFGSVAASSSLDKPLFGNAPVVKPQSTTPAFAFAASQKTAAPAFSFGSATSQPEKAVTETGSRASASTSTPAFAFSAPTTATFTFGQSGPSTAPKADVTPAKKSTEAEHSKHGGFSFGFSSGAQVQPTKLSVRHDNATIPATATVLEADDEADSPGSGASTPALVHQLRDGTEYVSPSKPRSHKSPPRAAASNDRDQTTAAAPASVPTAGFVFKPPPATTAGSASTAFSFDTAAASTTASMKPIAGGFVFNPSSTAPSTVQPMAAPSTNASTTQQQSSSTERAVATLPDAELLLDLYAFDEVDGAIATASDAAARERALMADLIDYEFDFDDDAIHVATAMKSSTAPAVTNGANGAAAASQAGSPNGGEFDWASAGLQPPTKDASGWTCPVCMLSNVAGARQCIACEADAPPSAASASVAAPASAKPAFSFGHTQQPVSQPPVAPTTGGFDWAKAGMAVPKSSGWTCGVCMISNPDTATQCQACESDRP